MMDKNNLAIARAYYTTLREKEIDKTEKFLHPNVQIIGPLAKMMGKETVLEALKKFTNIFKTLTIRQAFAAEDQAVIIYDLECPAPIGTVPTAAFVTLQKELITKIELFFDGRPFDKK
ncbi:nuclear transport factor 2 family protein [Parachlamydia sp. AcF125]|uniref:nuclear transport factor 2 family protein n=1 Tax=Parachlamydia sp. AcF125 TaxID=2795736 RepID=UPI001BC9EF96|nr:nuclear transport factor 2 family protein [Parachlamydia sp. AcF125]MBS4169175.1 hypothetical protein [Parachlamydia sp. AcF125]